MGSTTSSPSKALSPHRKRRASDDYVEWWLADQQEQMNFEQNPKLQDTLNTLLGSLIPASSTAPTNSGERLRSGNAPRGAKRVFYLESNTTSSTASSYKASLIFITKSSAQKRARTPRTQRDAQQAAAVTESPAPNPEPQRTNSDMKPAADIQEDHPGQEDANALQPTDTIVQRLEKFSFLEGTPPSHVDSQVILSSRSTSPMHEWPKETPDLVAHDVRSAAGIGIKSVDF